MGDTYCLSYRRGGEPEAVECDQGMCIVPCRDELHLVDTVLRILAMVKLDIQDYAARRPWLDAIPQAAARIYLDPSELSALRRALHIVSSLARQLGDEATRAHADGLAKMIRDSLPGRPSDWVYALDRIMDRLLELQARLALKRGARP